jgi:hypothetical protein
MIDGLFFDLRVMRNNIPILDNIKAVRGMVSATHCA